MGLGLFGGGAAAARYLARAGAEVTVTYLRDELELAPAITELQGLPLSLRLAGHREEDFTQTDLIVANPAVGPGNRYLRAARDAGVAISSEVALFLDACPAEVIAITGTQGKSTTTSYLAQLLEGGERAVYLGGNIGHSLLDELPRLGAGDICALELSSYQLEALPDQWLRSRDDSPIAAAALLNVLDDHLERHGSREEYARVKLRVFELVRSGGAAFVPALGIPIAIELARDLEIVEVPGPRLGVSDGQFHFDGQPLANLVDAPLTAPFQRENLLVALGLAAFAGVEPEDLAGRVFGLGGLPHRLDPVGRLGGRPLWDNAVSTTPDSTISALEALPEETVVMLGGKVKDLDLQPLLRTLRDRRARVVIFGGARSHWPEDFRRAGVEYRSAAGPREALETALELEGQALLFSPACSSFDAYPNFQARADEFLAHAEALGLQRTTLHCADSS